MAFVTVRCSDEKCKGVLVLGIDEWGSIFGKGQPRAVESGVVEIPCPSCKKKVVIGFEHIVRK